ncbi:hypothetical protein Hte_009593 [Hypoxylon texense]
MLRSSASVSPSCPRPTSNSLTGRSEGEQFDVFGLDSSARSIEVPKKISFPDPPRPPTPGPPPRPPPIPPRPPVPTPPPSPRSNVEAAWLQEHVATQLSFLAAQLLDIWFTPGALISLPYPDRPPTPGPRPGPVGPQPDVPTPPPSPRRSAAYVSCVKSGNDECAETRGLDVSRGRQLSYPQFILQPQLNLPLGLPTSSSSHLHKRPASQKDIYGDKLMEKSDMRYETRFHGLVYTIAPNGVSGPHMSHLGSHKASESACPNGTLHAGAGTGRNDPYLPRSSSPRKIVTAYPEAYNRADVVSPAIMTGASRRPSILSFGMRLDNIPIAREISVGM